MLYESEAGNFSITLAGDAVVCRRLSVHREPGYLKLAEIMRAADAAFCNFEFPMHDYEFAPGFERGTYGAAEPYAAQELRWMGINMVCTANNHVYNYGEGGLLASRRNLDAAGMVHAGTGRNLSEARAPAYLDTHNGRVALLAATSSFSEWGKAGNQRPDFRGRPGVSYLRYRTTYTVDAEALRQLKRISERLGLEKLKGKPKAGETGFRFITSFKISRAYDFDDVEFVEGDGFGVRTQLHAPDVEDILRWVADARRQADWVVFSLHTHEGKYPVAGLEGIVGNVGLRDVPPDFMEEFAHRCIDAGVDVFVGHGSHVARGIEIYKGRPIFYDMGVFINQLEGVRWLPADAYAHSKLGPEATPADFFDAWYERFPSHHAVWSSMLAQCRFKGGVLERVELYPFDLGRGRPRAQRGRPVLAEEAVAQRVIEYLRQHSKPYGVDIRQEEDLWVIKP